jgi:fibronectin type 3 domain-containing protein
LYTYNVVATDADGDTLTYSLTSNPTGMTIDSSTGVINWTPNTIGDFNVILKVSDGESFDAQSFTITISLTQVTTLSPPTGVSASDFLVNKVQITWNTVSGASHYQVYRADSLTGAKTAISGWQTGTSYDDTSVTPWTTYYYWVKAATNSSGDNASGFSAYDIGFADSFNISPPYNVSASDFLANKVQITWNTGQYIPIPTEASHYQVYRANNLLATKTAISGWQTGTSYLDTSVAPWTTYYYWVKAATSSSGNNASDFSSPDTGYAFSMLPSKEK